MAPQASERAVEKLFRHSSASITCTSGTKGERPAGCSKPPDFSPPILAGRDAPCPKQFDSKRRGDAYSVRHGENVPYIISV